MSWTVVTAPTELPVSLAEAKDHCVVTITEDDLYIQNALEAAVEYAQRFQSLQYITTTVDETFDCFESVMLMALNPIQSVTSITYLNSAGVSTVLATTQYQVDAVSIPGRITTAPTVSWPVVEAGRMSPITIRYVAGYGNAQQVPPQIKQGFLMLLSHFYSNRDAVDAMALKETPMAVGNLLSIDRIMTV